MKWISLKEKSPATNGFRLVGYFENNEFKYSMAQYIKGNNPKNSWWNFFKFPQIDAKKIEFWHEISTPNIELRDLQNKEFRMD